MRKFGTYLQSCTWTTKFPDGSVSIAFMCVNSASHAEPKRNTKLGKGGVPLVEGAPGSMTKRIKENLAQAKNLKGFPFVTYPRGILHCIFYAEKADKKLSG